jgi:hypothetical protein
MSKITTIINNIYKDKYGYEKYDNKHCSQAELMGELIKIKALDDQNLYEFMKILGSDFTARDIEGVVKFIYSLHISGCKIK